MVGKGQIATALAGLRLLMLLAMFVVEGGGGAQLRIQSIEDDSSLPPGRNSRAGPKVNDSQLIVTVTVIVGCGEPWGASWA